MRYSNQGRFRQLVNFLRRQFLQEGDLPFTTVLSEQNIAQALTAIQGLWKDRIYSPLVTLWVFLGQVLSADHSCRSAVAHLIAHRLSRGQPCCSAETGAYCQARKRLPEEFFSQVARQTGQTLEADSRSRWLWKGRRVYAFDGSTVTMPDTPENQEAYPQNIVQTPGLGFPIARIGAIFSLACGAVVDLGICRYAGKGQGELSVFRRLWGFFRPGDIVLTDRLMCTWREAAISKNGASIRYPSCRSCARPAFGAGSVLAKRTTLSAGPSPHQFVPSTGRLTKRSPNTSPFVNVVCTFSNPAFAAGRSSS